MMSKNHNVVIKSSSSMFPWPHITFSRTCLCANVYQVEDHDPADFAGPALGASPQRLHQRGVPRVRPHLPAGQQGGRWEAGVGGISYQLLWHWLVHIEYGSVLNLVFNNATDLSKILKNFLGSRRGSSSAELLPCKLGTTHDLPGNLPLISIKLKVKVDTYTAYQVDTTKDLPPIWWPRWYIQYPSWRDFHLSLYYYDKGDPCRQEPRGDRAPSQHWAEDGGWRWENIRLVWVKAK